MKRSLLTCICAAALSITALAQQRVYPAGYIDYELHGDGSLNNRGEFSAIQLSVAPGISVCRYFQLRVPLAANVGLFDLPDGRDFSEVLSAGLDAVGSFYDVPSDKPTR